MNISYLRKRLALTQKELADRLGIGPGQISKYEKGESYPPLDKIALLVELFDVSYNDIIEKDLSKEPATKGDNNGESAELKELLVHAYKNIYTLEREIAKLKGADEEFEKIDRAAEERFPYLSKKGKEDMEHD